MRSVFVVALLMIASLFLVVAAVYVLVRILKGIANSRGVTNVPLLVSLRFLTGPPGRNLLPVSLQNFISMVGVALGVWAMIVVLSVMGGFEQDLKSKIVLNVPHVQVVSESSFTPLKDVKGVVSRLKQAQGVKAVEPVFVGRAMVISLGNSAMSVEVRGVDYGGRLWKVLKGEVIDGSVGVLRWPALMVRDRNLAFRAKKIQKNQGIGPVPVGKRRKVLPAVLLGSELAKNLGVAVGDEVQIVVPDAAVGPMGLMPKTGRFVVGGLIKTGLYQFDLKTIYVSLDRAERVFGVTGPNAVGVWGRDPEHSQVLKQRVQAVLKLDTGVKVQGVFDVFKGLFSALKLERVAMFLVLGLVVLVAAFSIFGSLVMVGLERLPAISVLTAMGMKRGGLRMVFVGMGLSIGVTGTVSGGVLGLMTSIGLGVFGLPMPSQYYIRQLPVRVDPWEVLIIGLITLGLCVVSSLYPAATALRVDVATGLRNE